ncbi:CLUMA_CG019180, isoform A [Clunio marinus]|uniref:CLUMA_CG019180, isoform A n=1 Tax=Clunio marinus TaxID=568069 RepID=A0A1J1J243_9DIPT|nr:CLUMA_CG019180, isoform A [Clunio marinus]
MDHNKENTSSDPISFFPSEITAKIFNYLDTKDILAASEVSKSWYNFIADSSHCLRKVKLNFNAKMIADGEGIDNCISIMENNRRSYENIDITGIFFRNVMQALDMMKTSTRWKNMNMKISSFDSRMDYSIYFNTFANTMEDLRMENIRVLNNNHDAVARDLSFPKLKVLQAYNIEPAIIEDVFRNITTLDKLILGSYYLTEKAKDNIVKLLKSNKDLKILELSYSCFDDVMATENINEGIQFKLEKMYIGGDFFNCYNYQDCIRNNFINFLASQRESLTTLVFDAWMGLDILKMIYQLPNLKFLCIGNMHIVNESIDWENVCLPKSKSLTEVTLLEFPDSCDMLKAFASGTPTSRINVTFKPYLNFLQRLHVAYKVKRTFGKELNLNVTNWY